MGRRLVVALVAVSICLVIAPALQAKAREYDTKPITDPVLIAKMRQEGRLPDTYTKGNCRFELGGDEGAAYYHVTCQ